MFNPSPLHILFMLGAMLGCPRPAEAVSPRLLVEVVDISSPVLSPDGRRVAFRTEQANVERDSIDTAWYVQDVDGSAPALRIADGGFARHAFYGLSSPETAVWSPDGRWIYYLAMLDGAIDVWRAATDGSVAEAVTRDAADVRAFALVDEGRALRYSVGVTRRLVAAAERAEYHHGVRVDKTVPIGQALFRSGFIDGRASTQRYRGGRELERADLLADVADRWVELDLATGARRSLAAGSVQSRAAAEKADGSPEPWKQIIDGDRGRVALLVRGGDATGMYVAPYVELKVLPGPNPHHFVTCRAEPCHHQVIADAQWRPGTDELVFTVVDSQHGLAQSLYRWNIVTGAVHPVVAARGLLNGDRDGLGSCGISLRALVCVAAEADGPPRLERVDLEAGERHVLFEPNASLAHDIARTSPARLLRWKDAKGKQFTGQFFAARRREDGGAPPLFVNYYRCPGFVRGGTGDEWPVASLVEAGIAALCINYAPLPLDAVARYEQGLSAVGSAIDLLAAEGEVDRTRVGMGGLSLGAEVTLWTVVNSGFITAASVSSPAHTPLTYELRRLYDDTFLVALQTYWQLGAPEETPERWRKLSLVFNLDRVRSPILMQLPEQEYLQSIDYAVPLIKDDKAELYVFPDEAHFKFMPRHKLAAYERNLAWFRFWLLGFEDDDPRKGEQYEHWRVIREKTCVREAVNRDIQPWYCGKAQRSHQVLGFR